MPRASRHARALSAILVAASFLSGRTAAAQSVATLTSPADGTTGADLTQPFTWTSVANAQCYYLYMGSTPGAKDLVNSGETLQTSWPMPATLVGGQTFYARLWTKSAGIWRYLDSTFTASPLIARLTAPADGTTNLTQQSFTWSAVPTVQVYYLYVGTTVGAKDIVNSGETLQTSWPMPAAIPVRQMLYARMWTKAGGIWRYVDSIFSIAPVTSVLTSPGNGATDVPVQPFAWTVTQDVEAYYLYVGTTLGAKDVVNTGETLQSTWAMPPSIPAGQTLYARMWAKVGGIWRYTDSTFSIAVTAAVLTTPMNGVSNVPLHRFEWTSVPPVQAYYLYVGTSVGAKDVVNTGETLRTNWPMPDVPAARTLYARLWTRVASVWHFTDSTFTVAPYAATFVYPTNQDTAVDVTRLLTWSSIAGADAYYLYIGSFVGSKDLLDSGETRQTSWTCPLLPAGRTLYARINTRLNGVWRYTDISFSVVPVVAELIYPADGSTFVHTERQASWTSIQNATAYYLTLGTVPGGRSILDTGENQQSSWPLPMLPADTTIYARLYTRVGGVWRYSDSRFTLNPPAAGPTPLHPTDGETSFDPSTAIEWATLPLASAYRLEIGSARGANDLHDTGSIQVTARFVTGLPTAMPLYARISARVNEIWYSTDFTFEAAATTDRVGAQISAALRVTAAVRAMADPDNAAYVGTPLWERLPANSRRVATCGDYTDVLLSLLADTNIDLDVRRLRVAFDTNGLDVHLLTELLDPSSSRWILLDPTFDMQPTRRSDGRIATADEVQASVLAQDWGAITYIPLGNGAPSSALNYYVDYPLLYLNVFHEGDTYTPGAGRSPLPLLDAVDVAVSGQFATYVARCSSGDAAELSIDGVIRKLPCDGIDALTPSFLAESVVVQQPDAVSLFRAKRFVFVK